MERQGRACDALASLIGGPPEPGASRCLVYNAGTRSLTITSEDACESMPRYIREVERDGK
jgi:hypothetical protein